MTSRANEALRDGTLLAMLKHATFNHTQFTELLSIVSAKAAAMMRECEGMTEVVYHVDAAADEMENVYAHSGESDLDRRRRLADEHADWLADEAKDRAAEEHFSRSGA